MVRSFVRNSLFFKKCFSFPAIWTFGSWPEQNNLFSSFSPYVNFSGGSNLVSSWKRLLYLHIYHCACYSSWITCSFACCSCCLLSEGPSLKNWFRLAASFKTALSNNFFNSLWVFTASDVYSRKPLPTRLIYFIIIHFFFFFFWNKSGLLFNMNFACALLCMIPFKAPRHQWYDIAMFVCPSSIILWVKILSKSLIETDWCYSLFAIFRLTHSWHSGSKTSMLFLWIFSQITSW